MLISFMISHCDINIACQKLYMKEYKVIQVTKHDGNDYSIYFMRLHIKEETVYERVINTFNHLSNIDINGIFE